jgi:hypothetical protein
MGVSVVEVAEGIKPEVVGFLFVNPSYKISDLLRSAFGIAFKPTASINVHGAFPKIDRWSSRSHIRERTLQRLRTATQCLRHRTL